MDLSDVKNLLPAVAQALVRIVGIAAALKLVEELGGSTFPVPLRRNPAGEIRYQELAEVVGEEAASQMCHEIGGQDVYIPMCSAALRELRDRQIRADFDVLTVAPLNHSAIQTIAILALRYRISDRQVKRILKQTDRDRPARETQATLF